MPITQLDKKLCNIEKYLADGNMLPILNQQFRIDDRNIRSIEIIILDLVPPIALWCLFYQKQQLQMTNPCTCTITCNLNNLEWLLWLFSVKCCLYELNVNHCNCNNLQNNDKKLLWWIQAIVFLRKSRGNFHLGMISLKNIQTLWLLIRPTFLYMW